MSGLFLAAYSIIFGIETAKGFRQLIKRCLGSDIASSRKTWRVGSYKRHLAVWAVLLVMLGCLWSVSGFLVQEEFRSDSSDTHLWLACIVGPVGVWIRWFLARLNGRGLGKTQLLKWVPFGTLIANVSAACIMAALATMKKEVRSCNLLSVETRTMIMSFSLLFKFSAILSYLKSSQFYIYLSHYKLLSKLFAMVIHLCLLSSGLFCTFVYF